MAPTNLSAGRAFCSRVSPQQKTTAMTPTKETAFNTNAPPGPEAAMTRPPSAGPTARAMLNPTLPSATAPGKSSLGTNSGMHDCHAGALVAAPIPSENVSNNNVHGVGGVGGGGGGGGGAISSIQLC